MFKKRLQQLSSHVHKNYSKYLLVLVFILTAISYLGLGFKNLIPANLLIIAFCLAINPKFNYSSIPSNKIIFFLIFCFNSSFFFSLTPFGFYEFINFNTAFFAFLTFSNHPPKNLKTFYTYLPAITSIFSIVSIINLIQGPLDRAYGSFKGLEAYTSYPNAFADLLLFSNLISLSFLFSLDFKKEKLNSYLAFTTINITTLLLTQSRGAILAYSIGLVILLAASLLNEKIRNIKKILIVIFISLFSILPAYFINTHSAYYQDPIERLSSQDISASRSSNERLYFWSGSLEIISDYPVFGIGSGSFEYIFPRYQTKLLANAPHSHNLFLKVATENGVATSLLLLSLIILSILSPLIKKNYAFLLFAPSILSLNAHHLIDFNLNFPSINFIFFLSLGLLASSLRNTSSSQKQSKLAITYLLLVICIVGVQLVAYSHIKKIENQIPSQNLDIALLAPFPHHLFQLEESYVPTNNYPNFHPVLYQKAKQELLKDTPDIAYISEAISNNYLNDLRYHWLYIQTLQKLDETSKLINFENQMFNLLKEYNQLLKVNTHNTVVSKNPKAALNIIEFYINFNQQNQSSSTINDWEMLYTSLRYNYQTELLKFDNRFNSEI